MHQINCWRSSSCMLDILKKPDAVSKIFLDLFDICGCFVALDTTSLRYEHCDDHDLILFTLLVYICSSPLGTWFSPAAVLFIPFSALPWGHSKNKSTWHHKKTLDFMTSYLWSSRSCAWTSSRRLPTWLSTRPWRTPSFHESNQPAYRPRHSLWVSISH